MLITYYLRDLGIMIGVPFTIRGATLILLSLKVIATLWPLCCLLNSSLLASLMGWETQVRKPYFFSETWVERSINKGKFAFALFMLEKGEDEKPLHPLAQPLI